MGNHICRGDWFNCSGCNDQICDECTHPEYTHLCYDCGEEEYDDQPFDNTLGGNGGPFSPFGNPKA